MIMSGEGSFKAAKGLIRVLVAIADDAIGSIQISGDFFMYPEDALWDMERTLVGVKTDRTAILSKVSEFYRSTGVLTPGVEPEDFAEAIVRSVESAE
jgi:hypothetical protein